ncbi:hypothetical protein BDZ89DRAFT_1128083 [Hymenopellis radicata]|nr:hypothetical protein BDZ89DRAFT_1128083 [Hymenopellis radicata]
MRERVLRLPSALPESWPDTGAQTIRGPSLPHMKLRHLEGTIANEVEDERAKDGNARQAEPPQSDNKPSAGKL